MSGFERPLLVGPMLLAPVTNPTAMPLYIVEGDGGGSDVLPTPLTKRVLFDAAYQSKF